MMNCICPMLSTYKLVAGSTKVSIPQSFPDKYRQDIPTYRIGIRYRRAEKALYDLYWLSGSE